MIFQNKSFEYLQSLIYLSSYDSTTGVTIVTGSADSTLKLIDIVAGFRTVVTMKSKEPIVEALHIHNLTIAGTVEGNICVYDNDSGQCLYGFGAMTKGSVRCMHMNTEKTKLVVCGDDFNPLVMEYA